MKNFKFVTIFSVAGFILSLLFGLFSGASFGKVILTALIFAVIFAVLSFAISFIYTKFLYIEDAGDYEASADGTVNLNGDADIPVKNDKVGQHVNLVIQDEALEQTGSQNHYDVGENHQMLNDSDYVHQNYNQSDDVPVQKNEFIPIRNLETINNFSGSESMTPEDSEKRRAVAAEQENTANEKSVDVLPDMSEFVVSNGDETQEEQTIVLSDADNAGISNIESNSIKSSDTGEVEIKDASLMAKAISSILAEET